MITHTGAACRNCGRTEQECAFRQPCCSANTCSHWNHYDNAGNLLTPNGRPTLPLEHGTERGYGQHRRAANPACLPCRVAHAETVGRRKAS